MAFSHTIVAQGTASGWSERAIIRLSGHGVPRLLQACLAVDRDGGVFPFERTVRAARLRMGGVEFPLMVICFPGPRSYTGEHTAELILPGNPHLVELVLQRLLQDEDVRPANPGEFSARAYINGRLSLEQAEGVAATIAAQTDDQLRAARQIAAGTLGSRAREWNDRIANLLALVEAGIDFTDQEDVVAIEPRVLAAKVDALISELKAELGGAAESSSSSPRIALAGAPNSGKSTLFNALIGRERAVVSDVRGTTRDVIAESLDLSRDRPGGPEVILQDLPGLDPDAEGRIDTAAQDSARNALAESDVIVWCDPAGRFEDSALRDAALRGKPIIRVRTKADRAWIDAQASTASLSVCALDGHNLGLLRAALADACAGPGAGGGRGGVASLLPRHRRALTACAAALTAVRDRMDPGQRVLQEPELVGAGLRLALDEAGELAGRISPDEVLGRVFATFCVGK